MARLLAPRNVIALLLFALFATALLYNFHLERKLRALCDSAARVETAEAKFYTNYPDLAADPQLRVERGRIRDTCASITWDVVEQPHPRE
jgi:hypothetical protein